MSEESGVESRSSANISINGMVERLTYANSSLSALRFCKLVDVLFHCLTSLVARKITDNVTVGRIVWTKFLVGSSNKFLT
jgi:hypothetical protein